MTKNKITAAAFSILVLSSSLATFATAQTKKLEKPNAFLINLIQTTREQSVANIMRQFRQYAGDDSVLEENETKKFNTQQMAMTRANSMRRLMQLDHNGDGKISKEELIPKTNSAFLTSSTYLTRLNKSYGKLDTDKDGLIEILEAYKAIVDNPDVLTLSGLSLNRTQNNNVSKYLDLVPKGQPRKLTADALEQISRDAFAYFDINGDGVLRGEELKVWQKERRTARRVNYGNSGARAFNNITPGTCSLPKPGPRDIVVLAALNKSNRQSNISLQNKNSQTGVFTLHIEKGDKPIYAIVHTMKPTIIRLSGDVKRVSQLVNVTAQVGGVYDFDQKKVSFESAIDCFATFVRNTSASATLAKSVVKGIVGRRVDRTVSAYTMDRLSLPSAKIDTCSSSFKKRDANVYQKLCGMPSWFKSGDTATHKAIARHHPAGADILEQDKLYTLGNISASEFYPAYMGMMQFINDGAAEELSGGGYFIKKDIENYPTGFHGKMATRFLFAKGVVPPLGRAGSSCIEMEDKSLPESPLNQIFCNLFNR